MLSSIRQSLSANVRLLRWPVVTSLVSVLAILAITVGLVWDARRQVETRTRESSWNLLRAIQRDISRNIEVLDLSLQAVVDGLARPAVMALPPLLRNQVLFDRSATATGVGALIVFDRDGERQMDSVSTGSLGFNVADREYFTVQRDGDKGLFVSRPYRSRLLDKEVVGLSRRVSNADGSFAGVALASIQVAYFEELFRSLHLDPGAVLSLVRLDGSVLLRLESGVFRHSGDFSRSPVFQALRQAGSGDYVGRSSIDQIERLYSFTRLGDFPLLLTIGIPIVSVYGDWAQKSLLVLTALGLISTVLVALCLLLSRELTRRSVAEAKLLGANAELERLSTTDALTGLGNRRLFDECLARETRRALRTGKPLFLVIVDVDHFKLFNDRYGHPRGDDALRTVAAVLRAATRRPGDTAYRIGGEEFGLILGETDRRGAAGVMAAIRRELEARAMSHASSPKGRLTVSQGAAQIFGEDEAAAIARADQALYRAKRDGRDRAYVQPLLEAA